MYLKQNINHQTSMKLTKCKSQEQFIKPIYTDRSIAVQTVVSTRPKFQSFRARSPKDYLQGQQFVSNVSRTAMESVPRVAKVDQLSRVKSVDNCSQLRGIQSFENIMEAYKQQNENLKQQNSYLFKEIRKKRKNEEALSNYIDHLRCEIKKLQDQSRSCSPISILRSNMKISSISKLSRQQSSRMVGKLCDQGDTWNTMEEIEDLNEKFNQLLDQCSKEKCRRSRAKIREKLAETAQKMKSLRKDMSEL